MLPPLLVAQVSVVDVPLSIVTVPLGLKDGTTANTEKARCRLLIHLQLIIAFNSPLNKNSFPTVQEDAPASCTLTLL